MPVISFELSHEEIDADLKAMRAHQPNDVLYLPSVKSQELAEKVSTILKSFHKKDKLTEALDITKKYLPLEKAIADYYRSKKDAAKFKAKRKETSNLLESEKRSAVLVAAENAIRSIEPVVIRKEQRISTEEIEEELHRSRQAEIIPEGEDD